MIFFSFRGTIATVADYQFMETETNRIGDHDTMAFVDYGDSILQKHIHVPETLRRYRKVGYKVGNLVAFAAIGNEEIDFHLTRYEFHETFSADFLAEPERSEGFQ